MSFLSRLSNLVSGMANNMLDSIEKSNPEITREYTKNQKQEYVRTLRDSLKTHKVLLAQLENERQQASDERIADLKEELLDEIYDIVNGDYLTEHQKKIS